jgi:hypothetical protein
MRVLLISLLTTICLISCEINENHLCVDTFPTTLIYDTINTVETAAYNTTGKMSDYDETFDEFDYSPLWLSDSIKLINNSEAISFTNLIGRFGDMTTDSLELKIFENKIQTVPNRLPTSIIVLDTKESENIRLVEDINIIKPAVTRTYYLRDNKFILPLFAIRIFIDNNGAFGGYDMTGQNSVNDADIADLYTHLESNETLSVIKYELIFTIK